MASIVSIKCLDTRVSLKKALEAEGFHGGSRGMTEWNQWVQSEKEQLARVMERHGYEWEKKGTHEEHLSVTEYKKQERERELATVEEKLEGKQEALDTLEKRIGNLENAENACREIERKLEKDPEYQLPEPSGFMTARSYMVKLVAPLIERLKEMIKSLVIQYFRAVDKYYRESENSRILYRDNKELGANNNWLRDENEMLRKQNKDYAVLRKVFGREKLDELVTQAKEEQQAKKRARNRGWER